jgi:hypothetical protein
MLGHGVGVARRFYFPFYSSRFMAFIAKMIPSVALETWSLAFSIS